MTEDEVIKILGEPVTSYNANEKARQPRRRSSKKKFIRITSWHLFFSEIKGKYVLTAAASVGENDTFQEVLKSEIP